jgi:L-alanine-DL-glutamate epimerase-like enolase superfamily enzyme
VAIETDEEVTGRGYTGCAAHLGASQPVVLGALDQFREVLAGQDPLNLVARLEDLDRCLAGNEYAKAGIDLALHDLIARALKVPLYRILGGLVRTEVPILRIVPIKTPREMAQVAQKLVDEGYRYLKIKVEGVAAEDVARIRAIREQVGPGVHLTIDANQAYTPKDAIRAIRRMEPYDIDLVEQPVRADDFEGLGQVTRAVDIPVDADESAHSVEAVYRLVADRLVDSVSLKVPKLGGLRRAQEAAAICRAGNVECRLGAAVGSRLLAAACLHFAAATPNVGYAAELAEFARLFDDPAEGLEVEDGVLRLPQGVGVGVNLRQRVAAGRDVLGTTPGVKRGA